MLYINVRNVSKYYYTHAIRNLISPRRNAKTKGNFAALSDISFRIQEGERIGVIGSNGAGKTTLLNIISGYSAPSTGTLDISGKVSAVLEIGTSVDPELTGRENIALSGELYGKTKEEINALLPEIMNFVDIGEYFDRPVKTYSSGMKARIAFSAVSFIQPEILIIDEVLGVGDASFALKSAQKIRELCAKGKILLIVSHSMKTIREFSDRCLWLDQGRIRMDGPTEEVTQAYIAFVRNKEEEKLRRTLKTRLNQKCDSALAQIVSFSLSNESGETLIYDVFDDIKINISVQAKSDLDDWDIVLTIRNMSGVLMMENKLSQDCGSPSPLKTGSTATMSATMSRCNFVEDTYEVVCSVFCKNELTAERLAVFSIENHKINYRSKPQYFPSYSVQLVRHEKRSDK